VPARHRTAVCNTAPLPCRGSARHRAAKFEYQGSINIRMCQNSTFRRQVGLRWSMPLVVVMVLLWVVEGHHGCLGLTLGCRCSIRLNQPPIHQRCGMALSAAVEQFRCSTVIYKLEPGANWCAWIDAPRCLTKTVVATSRSHRSGSRLETLDLLLDVFKLSLPARSQQFSFKAPVRIPLIFINQARNAGPAAQTGPSQPGSSSNSSQGQGDPSARHHQCMAGQGYHTVAEQHTHP
jgi:hypothetical protein